MRFRTVFLFLLLALTALFAVVNWPAFTAPTTLSLVLGTVTAPLGLIMLGVVFAIGAVSLAYLIYVQGTALRESRRHARDMQAQRELVENAETSRFTELHNHVGGELRKLEQLQADTREHLLTRLDQFEQRLRLVLQEAPRTAHDIDEPRGTHGPNGGIDPARH